MESSRSWYKQPQYSSHRQPARTPDPLSSSVKPGHPSQRQKKVVQIPVQFVGSKPMDRSGSAVRIQKVFRGFLVRKNVKKIKDVKKQVDEIEEKLMTREVVELIRNNEKERLTMSECLMYLLFKLDSVPGVDLGIRVFRKAVTRKAILLQERVDSILNVDLGEFNEYAEIEDEVPEIRVCEETEISNQLGDSVRIDGGDGISEETHEMLVESEQNLESVRNDENTETIVDVGFNSVDETHEMLVESEQNLESVSNDEDTETIVDVGVDRVLKVCNENGSNEEFLIEDDGNNKVCEEIPAIEEMVETDTADDWVEVEDDRKVKDGEEKSDGIRNNELMEKLMKENEKMSMMMTHLFESNEKQMKMLTALSHRVEMLENAVLCNVHRRKSKKKSPGCGNE